MRASKTWIILANGEHARFLEREGLSQTTHQVVAITNPERPRGKETYGTPLGRVFESHETARHAIEPRRDLNQIRQRKFAGKIARILETYAIKRRFDRAIIVAGHTMLGALRKEFGPKTASVITKEIDRDWINLQDDKIVERLEKADV